jgi:hypothetical protein
MYWELQTLLGGGGQRQFFLQRRGRGRGRRRQQLQRRHELGSCRAVSFPPNKPSGTLPHAAVDQDVGQVSSRESVRFDVGDTAACVMTLALSPSVVPRVASRGRCTDRLLDRTAGGWTEPRSSELRRQSNPHRWGLAGLDPKQVRESRHDDAGAGRPRARDTHPLLGRLIETERIRRRAQDGQINPNRRLNSTVSIASLMFYRIVKLSRLTKSVLEGEQ